MSTECNQFALGFHPLKRREIVHWTIREAQSEIAPGVIYDDAWGFDFTSVMIAPVGHK